MKAVLTRTSDWMDKKAKVIEVNSIEDLLKLHKEKNNDLIISRYVDENFKGEADFTIEIYDDYRE